MVYPRAVAVAVEVCVFIAHSEPQIAVLDAIVFVVTAGVVDSDSILSVAAVNQTALATVSGFYLHFLPFNLKLFTDRFGDVLRRAVVSKVRAAPVYAVTHDESSERFKQLVGQAYASSGALLADGYSLICELAQPTVHATSSSSTHSASGQYMIVPRPSESRR